MSHKCPSCRNLSAIDREDDRYTVVLKLLVARDEESREGRLPLVLLFAKLFAEVYGFDAEEFGGLP
jgi:hypothetical protein